MSQREPWRDTWRRGVLRDRRINNATRIVLVVLADHMDDDGFVSVPRSKLSQILNVDPSRITEGIAQAHQAGLIETVVAGKPGTTARYVARASDGAPLCTKRRASRGAPLRTKDMVGIQHQAEVRPSAPSGPKSHAQHGAPVLAASSTQPEHSDVAETTGSNVASATENPSTSDQSSFSSRSRRSREQAPKATGPSSPSAPSTQADDAAATDSKVPAGVAGAAVARPPKPMTAKDEDEYQSARGVLEQLNPTERDKCMAIAHNSLASPSGRELIMYAADVARTEIGVAS